MKLIHTADLHLDSRLSANLSPEAARERNQELVKTFLRMTDYAVREQVDAILISGDLFDTGLVSSLTAGTIREAVLSHSQISFYYLSGNHDMVSGFELFDKAPGNWISMGEGLSMQELGGQVRLWGLGCEEDRTSLNTSFLFPDPEKINILMMHGQDGKEFNLGDLRNRGLDYIALGHLHSYQEIRVDDRCTAVYPGCLEGRGFDEAGPHGFMLLEIDEASKKINHVFVPFAARKIMKISVDVTGLRSSAQMLTKAEAVLASSGISEEDYLLLTLSGKVDPDCEKNTEFMKKALEDRFYAVKVLDSTTYFIHYEDYAGDMSLKGEFVRTVMGKDLTEEEKGRIIAMGLAALSGEELIHED